MGHDGSDASFKAFEASLQALYQPFDIAGGERAQEGIIWQDVNPPLEFTPYPDIPFAPTTINYRVTTLPRSFNNVNRGNLASSSTLGYSRQYSRHSLRENSTAEYAYSGPSTEALGSSITHFTAPQEVSNLNDRQNHIYPVPSRGMTTDRCGIQRRRLRTIRDSRPRTTSNTPVATGHPHHHPPHTEIRDVPDSYLLPSVQPVAVEPALNVDEDIERHIGYDDEIRWFCIRCNEKSGNRKNRIRDHVAACLGYAIYPCTGGCGNPTCQVKCKTRQNLREHQHPQRRICPQCGDIVRRQNLNRHISNKHRQGT